MTTNLNDVKNVEDGRQVVKEAVSKSDLLAMIGKELDGQINPMAANEILAVIRREKVTNAVQQDLEETDIKTRTPEQKEKELFDPRKMAKEMVQNWYTSIGKYSEKIPYEEGDNQGYIYWDAMTLSSSLGFKRFSNGQAVSWGKPFILDKPIRDMYNKMSSSDERIRESETRIAEERLMQTLVPLVDAFENAEEIKIEFTNNEAVSFVSSGCTEGSGSSMWKPVSWVERVIETKLTKQDFIEGCKRGRLNVECWKGQNISFITFDMFKSVVPKKK